MAKASAKHAVRAKALPVRHATVQRHHAGTALKVAPKVLHVLKVRAMVAEKVDVMADAAKSNAAIHALRTAVMAKAVLHGARVMMAVDLVVARKGDKVGKTATATTVTNCHATLTP